LHLFNGQVDQHTSNLGGFVFTSDLLNELVDDFSDLILIVRVLGVAGGENLEGFAEILLLDSVHLISSHHLRVLLLLLHHHGVHLRGSLLRGLAHSHTGHHVGRHLAWHLTWHGALTYHRVTHAVIGLGHAVLGSLAAHVSTSAHSLLLLLEVELGLDESNELIEDGKDLRLAHQLRNVGALFLIVLEISLVVHLLILSLSDFLNFVVVNVELLSVEGLLVESSLGSGSSFGVLEALEGIDCFAFFGEDLDAFNVTVFSEKILQLF